MNSREALIYIYCTLQGASILDIYNNNLSSALVDLFPDIGIDAVRFQRVPGKRRTTNDCVCYIYYLLPAQHWDSVDKQREMFVTFAKEHNFDPNVPENWYASAHSIHNSKVLRFAELYY